MTIVGELSLWIALLMAAWSCAVSLAGAVTTRRDLVASGERASVMTCGFTALAALGLCQALVRRDFSYSYVAAHVTANMPGAYAVAALWAGSGGATLLWALCLAIATAVATRTARSSVPAIAPIATGVLGAALVFAIGVVALGVNPFDRATFVPADGDGMNPQLQNPGMLLHPPLLMAGLTLTAVPCALGVGALLRGVLTREWIATARRWCVAAWVLLGAGILSGMWWAYVEPGWGGYWSWDPVQSAALLPWLACAAGLHSLPVLQRRGLFPKWSLALSMLPFPLAVFAGFVARGVLMDSIHAFARSAAGTWFSGFLILVSVVVTLLLATRPVRVLLPTPPAGTTADGRDVATLYGTVVLAGMAFSVLVGMLFPLFSQWMRDTPLTVAGPYFRMVLAPFAIGLVVLMATELFLARRRAPRRHQGARHLAHLAVVILLIAFAGMAFSRTYDVSLTAGQTFDATDPFGRHWRVTSQGISRSQYRNSEVLSATLEMQRAGKSIGLITTEKRQYVNSQGRPLFEPSTEAGIHTDARLDTYVVLARVDDEVADVRISFHPLVVWVWIGGAMLLAGGALAMWPAASEVA